MQTRTVTLEAGESDTVEFKISMQSLGTYYVEIEGLVTHFIVSVESSGTDQNLFPIEYLVVILVVVGLFLVVFFLFRRREPNIEKIYKMNPRLNQEEKDVIQFLVDNGTKAFEAEIRERFPDIPRTSLWRLVKRLEKMGIVSIKKIGLENRVELK